MALTWTEIADTRQNVGFSWITQVNTATPAASDYVTGGYANPFAAFGFGELHGLTFIGFSGTAGSYIWRWNFSTNKIQVYQSAGGTPSGTIVTTMTSTTNASTAAPVYTTAGAVTQIAGAAGITGFVSTFTGAAGGSGGLTEVGAGTDLSGGSIKVIGYGF